MAVYNGADYLGLAIDDILAQSFTDFEFVIVDDASTDGTSHILRSYGDPRIRILRNDTNLGLSVSLNRAMSVATGSYIARQDADDRSHPERMLYQVSYLDAHPSVGLLGTAARWVDARGSQIKVWPEGQGNAELQQLLMSTCPLIHGSTMYRRQCFDEAGGYDSSMRTGQDYDLWLRISETWDLVCLPQVLYTYRHHRDMASMRRKDEQLRNAAIGRGRAIRRRTYNARLALGLGRSSALPRAQAMSRRQLAQRYVWWSAGARCASTRLALRFLAIAFAFDPTAPEVWSYIRGILGRKTGLGN